MTEPTDLISPTPERMRRGVELLNKSIADEAGRPSQPYRSIDILSAMHRRGSITAEMRQAGDDFQALFRLAQLDPLHAADMSRTIVSGSVHDSPAYRIERARESVWKTIMSAGGLGSAGGSCLWHVLGLEWSLSRWATEQGFNGKRISTDAAPMVLITALGVLANSEKAATK
jgi:hypothetical protein